MNNRIEAQTELIAKLYIIGASLQEKGNPRSASLVIEGSVALRDSLPVIEAALAANPVTSIAVALGDTLNPWKEAP